MSQCKNAALLFCVLLLEMYKIHHVYYSELKYLLSSTAKETPGMCRFFIHIIITQCDFIFDKMLEMSYRQSTLPCLKIITATTTIFINIV